MLAGGRSTRFGSDKMATTYLGKPLLHHAIERLAEVCDELVVVLSPTGHEPTVPEGITLRFARDTNEGEGPLAGFSAGLMATRTDLALVTGGDMPDLQRLVLEEMIREAREGAHTVVLQEGDRFRPLPCVVLTRQALEKADSQLLMGERSLRAALEAMSRRVIDEASWTALDPERGTLHDVDEPGDIDA